MDPLSLYGKNARLVHSIFNSRLKIQVLLALQESDAPLSVLRDVTGSTSQALIPKIRSLEGLALVESREHRYALTPLGYVVAGEIFRYISLVGGLGSHLQFWATHDLSGIPRDFIARIGDLVEGEVQYDTTMDMFSVYTHYISILREASYIHGLSSVASPGLAQFLTEKIHEGIPVELVVSDNVIELLGADPYITFMENLYGSPHFTLFMFPGDMRLGLTVTDKNLSLGLYKRDIPQYDSSCDLFSGDPRAVAWGESLFQYYREKGRSVPLEKFIR
jgi:predicted transcriptional regulator